MVYRLALDSPENSLSLLFGDFFGVAALPDVRDALAHRRRVTDLSHRLSLPALVLFCVHLGSTSDGMGDKPFAGIILRLITILGW